MLKWQQGDFVEMTLSCLNLKTSTAESSIPRHGLPDLLFGSEYFIIPPMETNARELNLT